MDRGEPLTRSPPCPIVFYEKLREITSFLTHTAIFGKGIDPLTPKIASQENWKSVTKTLYYIKQELGNTHVNFILHGGIILLPCKKQSINHLPAGGAAETARLWELSSPTRGFLGAT